MSFNYSSVTKEYVMETEHKKITTESGQCDGPNDDGAERTEGGLDRHRE